MEGQTIQRAGSACLIFDISEFQHVSKLPEGVQSRWKAFSRVKLHGDRAQRLRTATHRIYSSIESSSPTRPRSPRKLRQSSLTDMRTNAAKAAASLGAASQLEPDADATSSLAARLLANMEAATQRRKEALEMRKARCAAKQDLLLQRLGAAGAITSEAKRRHAFLQQLRNRLATPSTGEGETEVETVGEPELNLKLLVAKHGVEDWMQALSPTTANAAAAFRVTRSSRRLQRGWRRFASQHKSTSQLAQAFAAQGVATLNKQQEEEEQQAAPEPEPEPTAGFVMIGGVGSFKTSSKHECFEDFAKKLQSPVTIKAAQTLLRRLEKRLSAAGVTSDGAQSLLRQLSPSAPAGRKLERYPVRVMLCAYMVKEHPEVVFNSVGDIEARLSAAAHQMLDAFEALLAQLLQPAAPAPAASSPVAATNAAVCPSPLNASLTNYVSSSATAAAGSQDDKRPGVARALFPAPAGAFNNNSFSSPSSGLSSSSAPGSCSSQASSPVSAQDSGSPLAQGSGPRSLASLLVAFDDSWLEYLDQFVVWKGRDAVGLEQELMRMAVRLERSMRLKLGRRELDSPEVRANPDLQAMIAQVSHDHALLAERIARLTGAEGAARLEAALAHVRQQVAAELQAAEDAASEASWETASEAGVRSRPASRAGSMLDPLSDAEALAAAQQAAAAHSSMAGRGSAPSSPIRPDSGDGAGEEGKAAESLGNEQMVWEMLYNPDYSLPTADAVAAWHRAMGKEVEEEEVDASDVESMTPEQLSALVARRARTIAERAFWDSIVWRFKTAAQGQALPSQLAPLLSELGTELSGFVTEPAEARQLAEQFAEPAVLARLTSSNGQQGGGANLTALGAMLEQLAQVLLKSGGPDRAAEGADAAQQLHARMAAALAAAVAPPSGSTSPTASSSPTSGSPVQAKRQEEAAVAAALAEGLAAALRLLMTQLKVVKLDAANTRLAGLARAMREQGAVRYLQTKLTAAWELPDLGGISSTAEREQATARVVDKLSRTAAWVAQVQQGLQQDLQRSLSSSGLLLDASAATAAVVAGGLQSVELRSGVRASPTAGRTSVPRSPGGSSAASPTAAGAVKARFPVALDTWQGAVRAGLLSLVSSTTPAAGPQTPEVLAFDRARLHDLQNTLQQLMVAAAGLLIVQQLRQAGGLPWDAEMRVQARRRLLVVLSDPGMKLAHLVTELTQLAGATGVATEDRVSTMFTTIVNPDAAGFKSIRTGIISALGAHLLYGRAALSADGSAGSALATVLGRVGAAALQEDVADLGQKLAGVAAVCEAVHGDVLALLAAAPARMAAVQ